MRCRIVKLRAVRTINPFCPRLLKPAEFITPGGLWSSRKWAALAKDDKVISQHLQRGPEWVEAVDGQGGGMNWILAIGGLISLVLFLSGLYLRTLVGKTPRQEPVVIPHDDQPR
jgi:hypothetical protein